MVAELSAGQRRREVCQRDVPVATLISARGLPGAARSFERVLPRRNPEGRFVCRHGYIGPEPSKLKVAGSNPAGVATSVFRLNKNS
jgi:hypothetical protein